MRTIGFALVAWSSLTGLAFAQQCLHDQQETADQQARRRAALAVARMVNTVEMSRPESRSRTFMSFDELAAHIASGKANRILPNVGELSFAPGTDIIPGWRLTLDATKDGYWFAITDTRDICGFAYISNNAGLIYTAQPLQ